MAGDQANVRVASVNSFQEVENTASAAAHAKFAEWQKQERDQQPRRVLLFSGAAVVISVATVLLIFLNRG